LLRTGGAWRLSIQLTILKVLAGHPEGRATHPDVTKSIALLMSSGVDWSQRMKRLAARALGLDIFSNGYVLRDASGWQITGAGRAFMASIEAPATEPVRASGVSTARRSCRARPADKCRSAGWPQGQASPARGGMTAHRTSSAPTLIAKVRHQNLLAASAPTKNKNE
jgi:hypothetical protein